MNVLSVFDGISCGQIALERSGIKVDNYYASEIDKRAIEVTQHNYPATTQLGSVSDVDGFKLPKIDLYIGGSPCQGFSFAGALLNFDDPRSRLVLDYVRILGELRRINSDILFLLENVKMTEKSERAITNLLGVRPIRLNSDIITAQSRQRLYWTNIPVNTIPIAKNISLQSVIKDGYLTDRNKSYCIDANYGKGSNPRSYSMGRRQIVFASEMDMLFFMKHGKSTKTKDVKFRILTPEECEELQTIPIGYTSIVSKAARYHGIGNAWTVDIIAHLFKHIKAK